MALRRATVSFALLQIGLGLVLLAGLWLAWPAWRLGMITDSVRKQYPGVPLFSTADLSTWLADPEKSKPLVLDVRSEAEYAFSHIVGAIRIDPATELPAPILPEDLRRVLIAYCSTGEKSAPFAVRLQEAGYTRVFALEGGIIRWINEGRPLTDGQSLVTSVHPGDGHAVRLLSRFHRDITTAPSAPASPKPAAPPAL